MASFATRAQAIIDYARSLCRSVETSSPSDPQRPLDIPIPILLQHCCELSRAEDVGLLEPTQRTELGDCGRTLWRSIFGREDAGDGRHDKLLAHLQVFGYLLLKAGNDNQEDATLLSDAREDAVRHHYIHLLYMGNPDQGRVALEEYLRRLMSDETSLHIRATLFAGKAAAKLIWMHADMKERTGSWGPEALNDWFDAQEFSNGRNLPSEAAQAALALIRQQIETTYKQSSSHHLTWGWCRLALHKVLAEAGSRNLGIMYLVALRGSQGGKPVICLLALRRIVEVHLDASTSSIDLCALIKYTTKLAIYLLGQLARGTLQSWTLPDIIDLVELASDIQYPLKIRDQQSLRLRANQRYILMALFIIMAREEHENVMELRNWADLHRSKLPHTGVNPSTHLGDLQQVLYGFVVDRGAAWVETFRQYCNASQFISPDLWKQSLTARYWLFEANLYCCGDVAQDPNQNTNRVRTLSEIIEHVAEIVVETRQFTRDFKHNVYSPIVDMILFAISRNTGPGLSLPTESAITLLKKIITHVRCEEKYDVTAASRWTRLMMQLTLDRLATALDRQENLEEPTRMVETLINQASDVTPDRKYPPEEIQWLAVKVFNLAVDLYQIQEDARGKKLALSARDLARKAYPLHDPLATLGRALVVDMEEKMERMGWGDLLGVKKRKRGDEEEEEEGGREDKRMEW